MVLYPVVTHLCCPQKMWPQLKKAYNESHMPLWLEPILVNIQNIETCAVINIYTFESAMISNSAPV